MKYIFDLDGTITSQETLPLIAKEFKIESQIQELTNETIQGNIPFIESFIRRVHILGKLPVNEISMLLAEVPLYEEVYNFIRNNKEKCCIATGNLDCWIGKLAEKVGCELFSSSAIVSDNKVSGIHKILRKENIVKHFHDMGEKVIFIGDGNNDMEAMRIADISIAVGLTHYPAKSILPYTNFLIFNEKSLCRQLNQLL